MSEEPGIPAGEVPLETIAVGAPPAVGLPVAPSRRMGPAPPVSVGSLLSRTFLVWTRNAWRFLGLGALMYVPIFFLAIFGVFAVSFGPGSLTGGDPTPAIVVVVVVLAVAVAMVMATMAGYTHGAVQTLTGRPFGFGEMVAVGFKQVMPVLGLHLLAGLAVLLGLVLDLAPGIILACGWAASLPAVVAERLGPVAAMKRSWRLTAGRRWVLFFSALVLLVLALVVWLLGLVIQIFPLVGWLIGVTLQLMVSALVLCWPAAVYHDLRVEKEGGLTDELVRVFE